ncbi:arylamine N-acetyltransferase [Cronobacter dublinensis]|uniref:arylamine N-acetyltransferase family protein n=1 Tax=Cronobacter dublinensis TaxID=413497 RepID=UPI0024AFE705|nr:arylamine N-acetyltransferase [Cronobacter dublinensis]MDI7397014.1 arylamine N-acetyltransferase [Cronobacter dublinensis]
MAFRRQDYFARIGFTGEPLPTLATLNALHQCHTATIPFENLDVLLGREILLDDDAIFTKLVEAGRGGYCFEQNALFTRALAECGFAVEALAARVLIAGPNDMPPRTHRLVQVTLDDALWIADVGFGGATLSAPIPLQHGAEITGPEGRFRIESQQSEFLLMKEEGDDWHALYRFDQARQYPGDYLMANHFIAHWPDSHFRHHLLAALHPPGETPRKLLNNQLTVNGERRTLADDSAVYDCLQTDFGMRFNHPTHGVTRDDFCAMMAQLRRDNP